MSPIHVIGVGLDGTTGLNRATAALIEQATLLVGSSRHLSYFPNLTAKHLLIEDFSNAIAQIRQHITTTRSSDEAIPSVVVLTSGDPLFFGLGRLLLEEFPVAQLTFHPHLSSIQLAFSRIKLSWQDAQIVSVHGRSLEELIKALQQGGEKIAVLTDPTNNPAAIARLLQSLELPCQYRIWVCENLGGPNEKIVETEDLDFLQTQTFSKLNVVVLQQVEKTAALDLATLPLLGIPDEAFLSFRDRPGLMTKREVRTLVLAELALQPDQVIWDIGAGTGSVSIEIARLCNDSRIYAIEKTAAGFTLIQKNCQRFSVNAIVPIQGTAPEALTGLPNPDRIFIGGSGGNLSQILHTCAAQLQPKGRIVLALATIEHLTHVLTWIATLETQKSTQWSYHLVQINLSRSVPIASLTRMAPLNPVTLVVLKNG